MLQPLLILMALGVVTFVQADELSDTLKTEAKKADAEINRLLQDLQANKNISKEEITKVKSQVNQLVQDAQAQGSAYTQELAALKNSLALAESSFLQKEQLLAAAQRALVEQAEAAKSKLRSFFSW